MNPKTDWFHAARWGVFVHYLDLKAERPFPSPTTAEQWNRRVDAFDVDALAAQLEATGAGYFLFTIGQNSGHWCAPNPTYDELTGISPSKCSRRDLIADLYEALAPKGIKLMVYLPSGAPDQEPQAVERLGWKAGDERLAEFQTKWEAIVRDWSLRWGKKVVGWWVDGCYYADAMYRQPEAPNFASFAAAMRAGNPASIVAFNPNDATPIVAMTEQQDYTAGEVNAFLPVRGGYPGHPALGAGRWVDSPEGPPVQYHLLTFLGDFWARGEQPRFGDDLVSAYTRHVNSVGGVVTWEVPISDEGTIPQPFIEQLKRLGQTASQ